MTILITSKNLICDEKKQMTVLFSFYYYNYKYFVIFQFIDHFYAKI